MNKTEIDVIWSRALREAIEGGEEFTRYRYAAMIADAEAKRIHNEGMVTVGHMREQIAAEREACAKVADGYVGADPIADAIRARGDAK